MRVTLYRCDRCSLTFVADERPDHCPKCFRLHTGSTVIRLAGRNVEVDAVKVFGDSPLKDQSIAQGLDGLRLGARCPHGFIYAGICPECN